jgi:hypothetical protein
MLPILRSLLALHSASSVLSRGEVGDLEGVCVCVCAFVYVCVYVCVYVYMYVYVGVCVGVRKLGRGLSEAYSVQKREHYE